MKRLIALALGLAAASALAQTPPSAANPDAGFFRPSDLAVPKAAAQPRPTVTDIRRAEETLRLDEEVLGIENRNDERIEQQMDRIERENERAREQPYAPITGAFTGLTDERSR
jgi:predicted component of type VI protein secretion system